MYHLPEGEMSYGHLIANAYRAEPTRLVLYARLAHVLLAHDDRLIEEDVGFLLWKPAALCSGTRSTRTTDHGSTPPVWSPASADRAFWITTDGRLLAFDYDARELVDYSDGYSFVGIPGG